MKVTKRINNNIVACCDDTGREYMAMGRGLGFDALLGDVLVESRVEKIFSIVPAKGYGSIESLFAKLPQERISACIEVIDYAKTVLPTKLNDSLYLTLTDHVNFAINHNCSDQQVGFLLTSEVKLCYPKEYLIGRFALKVFEKRLDVKLPDEEACAIALHIVNAEQLTGIGAVVHITETIKKTLQLLAEHLQISCEIQDANVAEFVSAYKFFLFHLTRDEQIPVTEQQLITGMYERLSVKVKPLCKAICSLIEQECKVKVDGLDLIWLEANIYCFVKLMERRKR